MYKLLQIIQKFVYSKKLTFIAGLLSGLAFAPTFFIIGLLALSLLCYQVRFAHTAKQAALLGFILATGHFVSGMYWIAIGVSVYIEEFWWAIPFALFGLPMVLACFFAISCALSWQVRQKPYYQLVFCLILIFTEWLRSWVLTGLPWNLLAYSVAFSDILLQSVSIIGPYGLSFIVAYIATIPYYLLVKDLAQFFAGIITSVILLIAMTYHGIVRLSENQTILSNVTVRIVQPSITQFAKWDEKQFWDNFYLQLALSKGESDGETLKSEIPDSSKTTSTNSLNIIPDIIIWSEAALVVPYDRTPIWQELSALLKDTGSILITGTVSSNKKYGDDLEIYSAFVGLSQSGSLFEYHKAHLVPFGEYMPFKSILPMKKITPGFLDYTKGTSKLVHLDKFNLTVRPLICYESIFPDEVRIANNKVDLFINITNDAWYGNSSGPYQHLYISKVRAIENGIPMLRAANNGISAIIDPVGRVVKQLGLNEVGALDSKVPVQILSEPTIYSLWGNFCLLIAILIVILMHFSVNSFLNHYQIIHKNT